MASPLIAFCDLQYCPVSYDFVTWLARAMLEKQRRGCDALHVVLVPNEGGLAGFSRHWGEHDEHATRWRLWHIVVASCPLARATVTVAESRLHAHRLRGSNECWWEEGRAHFMYPLVDAARAGEKIPRLQATVQARRYVAESVKTRPYVTLTVRNQTTDASRNSRRGEWVKLSEHLSATHHVVWLDDANDALREGRGFAEMDPDVRLALYEGAEMNFVGAAGPSVLLHFSDAPYRNVGIAVESEWQEHYRKYFHIDRGQQLPWAGPEQRMVFEPDTFDVMRAAW